LFIFTLALLTLPGAVFADVADQCPGGEAECYCFSSDDPASSKDFMVTSANQCEQICLTEADNDFTLNRYQVVCNDEEGAVVPIANGTIGGEASLFDPDPVIPNLSIQIPGFAGFTQPRSDQGTLTVNFIAEYIGAVYTFLIRVGALIAIVLLMVGGFQWMTSRGGPAIGQAKQRISTAFLGLTLLLSAAAVLTIIDPNTVNFKPLSLVEIDPLLFQSTAGEEGATGGADNERCLQAERNAKKDGKCDLPDGFASPITSNGSGDWNCNYHFREDDYDWQHIKALDYSATFGDPIYAPFAGNISYSTGTGGVKDRCGNQIVLNSGSEQITICHVKNFLNERGELTPVGTRVEQGAVIGHIGGACCNGMAPPTDYNWSQGGKCNKGGTPCTNPFTNESCQCQPYEQSGNTSGPHVHVTYYGNSDLLTCHK
ncbi:MAG: peptidoglycan DD-metalloendopeptidase family protein, partial [bacterium]|nr:peptidoglycan DD-metalloendopeptidase family protein [bacterium]